MPDIREITDLSAPELDVYARLSEGQLLHYYEPDTGLFIAESPKVISRALDAGYEPVSLLMEPERWSPGAAVSPSIRQRPGSLRSLRAFS